MSCLNPLCIKNPAKDESLLQDSLYCKSILVPCGKCIECRKARASEWRFRLRKEVELGSHRNCFFVTLTLSDEHLSQVSGDPAKYIRRFYERYRTKYGVSLKHWFVTELGGKNGRYHFHGIIWDYKPKLVGQSLKRCKSELDKDWKYGHTWVGWCDSRSANYIVKYMLKDQYDERFPDYKSKLFVSPAIGKSYVTTSSYMYHNQIPRGVYVLHVDGFPTKLPRYYYRYFFSDDTRWLNKYYLYYDPPSYTFGKKTYDSYSEMMLAKYNYYKDSLKRGTSTSNKSITRYGVASFYEKNGYFPEPCPICENNPLEDLYNYINTSLGC